MTTTRTIAVEPAGVVVAVGLSASIDGGATNLADSSSREAICVY